MNAPNKKTTSTAVDLIVQHNDLIEAKQNLTLQEKRIILWLSSQVRSNDEDFKEHELSIRDFCGIIGINSDCMYTRLACITKGLMKKVIEIKTVNGKDEILEQISLLSYVRYQKSLGTVVLSFHPQMKKVLLNLQKNFTKTSLSVSLSFSSLYSLRFYELFKKDMFMQVKSFSVLELRDLLCIKSGKYPKYKDLKKRVIESSINEINEKSDIGVDWVEIKTGRKVTSIKCSINVKAADQDVQMPLSVCNKFNISEHYLDRLRKEFSDDAVNQGLLSLETYKGIVKNPVLFLEKAIKGGWQPFQDTKQQEPSKELDAEMQREISVLDEDPVCLQIRKLFLDRNGAAEYRSWIQPLSLWVEDDCVVIVSKSVFTKDWLETNCTKQFTDSADGRKIIFRTGEKGDNSHQHTETKAQASVPKKGSGKKSLRKAKADSVDVSVQTVIDDNANKDLMVVEAGANQGEAIGKMIWSIAESKKKKATHRKQATTQEPQPPAEVVKRKSLWERITSLWK